MLAVEEAGHDAVDDVDDGAADVIDDGGDENVLAGADAELQQAIQQEVYLGAGDGRHGGFEEGEEHKV